MARIHRRNLGYLNNPDNHKGVITHLEPDILKCQVKWALRSITMNKPRAGDGIPVDLCEILKAEAVKVLHLMSANQKNSAVATGLEMVNFHSNPKERKCQRMFSFSSITQSCPTLCDPMDCSMPGLPVHHQLLGLLKLMSTESVMPSNHLIFCHPHSSCLQSFPTSGSFQMSQNFASCDQSTGVSASATVLPRKSHHWFPLGWTGWTSLQSKGLSRSSATRQFKGINSLAFSLLYSPTLTFRHDYWKNHNHNQTDLCWQSNISAF